MVWYLIPMMTQFLINIIMLLVSCQVDASCGEYENNENFVFSFKRNEKWRSFCYRRWAENNPILCIGKCSTIHKHQMIQFPLSTFNITTLKPLPNILAFTSLTTPSIKISNQQGDISHPWHGPIWIANHSLTLFPSKTCSSFHMHFFNSIQQFTTYPI